MKAELWTIRDIMNWSVPYLKKSGSLSARLDTELLLAESLNCQRIDLYLHHDKPLNMEERQKFRALLKRRAAGEPIPYILKEREFYGLSFEVTPDVLIPRPETEHLVEIAERLLQEAAGGRTPQRVLDIGTGSGCIAIALKKQLPAIQVEAWDICEKALDVAQSNSERHEVAIDFRKEDALNDMAWTVERPLFDVICSNPPYISHDEKANLPNSVLSFEPHRALFAADDGLSFYRKLAQHAHLKLYPLGSVVCEIGYQQGLVVSDIFKHHGWLDVSLHKDLAGLDRVITARRATS
ncbi:MAG: peptide chain release factor N(5)-glutamine methyltransferase [Oligoflexus sp.]